MICCCPIGDDELKEKKRINEEIEKKIKHDRNEIMMTVTLLLLGAGGSGKSTILKQMRIIHGSGYTENERKKFIVHIHRNVFVGISALVGAMKQLGIAYSDEQNEEYAEDVEFVDCNDIKLLSPRQFAEIKSLWDDDGIQEVYKKRNMFNLADSTKYYLDGITRIAKEAYVPTLDDVLRVRVPTTGIVEYNFDFDQIRIKMVDVGGQKSERRKWIHAFENVTSIMFLASLSVYDEISIESSHKNGIDETRSLFRTVISFKCLANASVILFLNKTDIFDEKIKTSNIIDHLSEYKGPVGDSENGKAFILKLFLSDNPDPKNKTIYYHYTCATDTDNINYVFNSIKQTVLNRNLSEMLS